MSNIQSPLYQNWLKHPSLRLQDNSYKRFSSIRVFTSGLVTIPSDGMAVGEFCDLLELPAGCMPVSWGITGTALAAPNAVVVSLGTPLEPTRWHNGRTLTSPGGTLASAPTGINLHVPEANGGGTEEFYTEITTPTVVRLTVHTNPWVAGKRFWFSMCCYIGGQ